MALAYVALMSLHCVRPWACFLACLSITPANWKRHRRRFASQWTGQRICKLDGTSPITNTCAYSTEVNNKIIRYFLAVKRGDNRLFGNKLSASWLRCLYVADKSKNILPLTTTMCFLSLFCPLCLCLHRSASILRSPCSSSSIVDQCSSISPVDRKSRTIWINFAKNKC